LCGESLPFELRIGAAEGDGPSQLPLFQQSDIAGAARHIDMLEASLVEWQGRDVARHGKTAQIRQNLLEGFPRPNPRLGWVVEAPTELLLLVFLSVLFRRRSLVALIQVLVENFTTIGNPFSTGFFCQG